MKRILIIYIVLVLGSAVLAGLNEPLSVPAKGETGITGMEQLLWLIAPLRVTLLLRSLGGAGSPDFGCPIGGKNYQSSPSEKVIFSIAVFLNSTKTRSVKIGVR